MSEKNRNTGLLVLALIPVALAAWTLWPADASKQNDLGYYSFCSFAPWSSLALLSVAGIIWAIRQYLMTRKN
jgi:hypothetical protein